MKATSTYPLPACEEGVSRLIRVDDVQLAALYADGSNLVVYDTLLNRVRDAF